MEKILVIGGGKWQVPIVKKAKDMGLQVVCTNLYEDSPAFEFADECYVADVTNQELNLEIAKKVAPNAVITDQSDIAVKTVALIAEKLNLPGNKYKDAELFTNKKLMRELINLQDLGLRHPKNIIVTEVDEDQVRKKIGFPAIIKPLSSQSSRGVFKVETIEQLNNLFNEAKSHSTDGRVLVEEYIGGVEITAEGFKPKNSRHKTLAISIKEHFSWAPTVASDLFYLQNLPFDSCKLKAINDELFSQVEFGITHVEYKYHEGVFYLIEAAIRGGGTKISSHIIPAVSGIDINKKFIFTALGRLVNFETAPNPQKSVALCFFDFEPGSVNKIQGIESLRNNKNIIDYDLEVIIGGKIEKAKDDRSRVGYFIAMADSDQDLFRIIEHVKKEVRVIYDY